MHLKTMKSDSFLNQFKSSSSIRTSIGSLSIEKGPTAELKIIEMTNAINNYYTEINSNRNVHNSNVNSQQLKDIEDFKKYFFPGLEKIINQIIKSVLKESERSQKIETVYKFYKGKSEYLKTFSSNQLSLKKKSKQDDSSPLPYESEMKMKNQKQETKFFDRMVKRDYPSKRSEKGLEYDISFTKNNLVKADSGTVLPVISKRVNPLFKSSKNLSANISKDNESLNASKLRNSTNTFVIKDRFSYEKEKESRFGSLIKKVVKVEPLSIVGKSTTKMLGRNKSLPSKETLTSKLKKSEFRHTTKTIKKVREKSESELKEDKTEKNPTDDNEENEQENTTKPIQRVKEKVPLRKKFPNIKNLDKHIDKLFTNPDEKIFIISMKEMAPKRILDNKRARHSKSLKSDKLNISNRLREEILNSSQVSHSVNVEVLVPEDCLSEPNNLEKNQTKSSTNMIHIRDHNIEQENFLSKRKTLFEFREMNKVKKSNKNIMNLTKKDPFKNMAQETSYYPKYFLPNEGYGLLHRPGTMVEQDKGGDVETFDKEAKERELEKISYDRRNVTVRYNSIGVTKTKPRFMQTMIGIPSEDVMKLKLV